MSRRERYWEQRRLSDRLLDPIAWWLLNPLFRSLDKKLCEWPNLTHDSVADALGSDDEAVA